MVGRNLASHKTEILEKYYDGKSVVSLSREYDVDRGYLTKLLKGWGVTIRQPSEYSVANNYADKIFELYKQGKSIEEVAKILGTSTTSITGFYKRNDLDVTRFSLHPINDKLVENEAEIISMYTAGDSCAKIARKFGVVYQTISKFLKARGIEVRKLETLDKSHDKIVELYNSGLSIYEIARRTGFGQTSLNRYCKKIGLDTSTFSKIRDIPLSVQTAEIIADYRSGLGCYILSKKYKCSESSILRLLKDNGVGIRPLRRLAVDESYFEKIDTEEKAYFFGFMIADGYNHNDYFSLSITDAEIVEAFKESLGSEAEIKIVLPRKENHKIQYKLIVCSTKMAADLTKLNCMRCKSLKTTFAADDIVPKYLKRHYLRGMLDGDGCITKDTKTNRWFVNFNGTKELCEGVFNFLGTELGLGGGLCQTAENNYRTGYGRGVDILALFHYFYDDCTIKLNRKFNRFKVFVEKFNNPV